MAVTSFTWSEMMRKKVIINIGMRKLGNDSEGKGSMYALLCCQVGNKVSG